MPDSVDSVAGIMAGGDVAGLFGSQPTGDVKGDGLMLEHPLADIGTSAG